MDYHNADQFKQDLTGQYTMKSPSIINSEESHQSSSRNLTGLGFVDLLNYNFNVLNGQSLLSELARDIVQQENEDEFSYTTFEDSSRNQTQKCAVANLKGNLQVLISLNIRNNFF